MADVVQEIAQNLIAKLAVGDLGMELDGVEPLFGVFHGRHGAHIRMGRDLEPGGHFFDAVGVAHPHHALGGYALHQAGGGLIQNEVNLAVLAGLRGNDGTAAHPGGELGAVADAENRNAQLQHLGVIVGGGHIIDAVGTAGEDDAAVTGSSNLLRSDAVVGLDFGVDVQVTNPAGNQLIILAAEVQNEDFFHWVSFLLWSMWNIAEQGMRKGIPYPFYRLISAISEPTPSRAGFTSARNASTCWGQRPI